MAMACETGVGLAVFPLLLGAELLFGIGFKYIYTHTEREREREGEGH